VLDRGTVPDISAARGGCREEPMGHGDGGVHMFRTLQGFFEKLGLVSARRGAVAEDTGDSDLDGACAGSANQRRDSTIEAVRVFCN
jgi:hypothetical protein